MAENDNQTRLENYLQVLVGLPLSIARNAADMKVFHFGTIRPHPSGRGTVGAYALHVQCPWRFVDEKTVSTGTSDRFVEPAEGTSTNDDDCAGPACRVPRHPTQECSVTSRWKLFYSSISILQKSNVAPTWQGATTKERRCTDDTAAKSKDAIPVLLVFRHTRSSA